MLEELNFLRKVAAFRPLTGWPSTNQSVSIVTLVAMRSAVLTTAKPLGTDPRTGMSRTTGFDQFLRVADGNGEKEVWWWW